VGAGTLSFGIGEAADALALAAADPAAGGAVTFDAPAPPTLIITLTPGASFPATGHPTGCTPAPDGSSLSCTFAQPAPGGAVPAFEVPVLVVAPGATATARIERGGAVEAQLPAPLGLELFEAGLDVTEPTWKAGTVLGHPVPVGHLVVGAHHKGPRTVSGATIDITLTGDAGFVHRLPFFGDLLPPGCTAPGAGGDATLPERSVLRGGLPTRVTCALDDLRSGATLTLPRIVALVRPWYDDGNGRLDEPVATVTLVLGERVVAQRTLSLAPTAPPPPA
jgi:hypothetical protein